ncbi:MAG: GerAB/ArcD/ProY family transporter [Bacilli bacterium]
MDEREKISSLQMGILIFFIAKGTFLRMGLKNIVHFAHQNGYLSIPLGLLLGFIPITIYLILINYKKEYNTIELNIKIFGPIIGAIINTILCLTALLVAIVTMLNLTAFISTVFLVVTPPIVIIIVFIAIIIIGVIKGFEVITRTACLLFLIFIILFPLPLIGLLPYVELNHLKPVLDNGLIPVMQGGLVFVSISVLPLYMLAIFPKKNITDEPKCNKITIFWYLITCLIIFIICFYTIAILSDKLCHLYKYPVYSVLKKISFLEFFERVEGPMSSQWIFDLFITISVALYFIGQTIKITFNIQKEKITNLVTIGIALILVLILNFFILPHIDYEQWLFKYYGYLLIPGFLIMPIITLIGMFIRRKAL